MSLIWIFQLSGTMLLQLLVSLKLISLRKNRLSQFSELAILVFSISFARNGERYMQNLHIEYIHNLYANYAFSWNVIWLYIAEYILMKLLLLIIVYALKVISFKNLAYLSQGKRSYLKGFQKTFNRWWFNADYGIRVKKGKPNMINKRDRSTNVRFDKNGFPVFYSFATIKLPKNMLHKDRDDHKRYASKALYRNTRLRNHFSKSEQNIFREGGTPPKYTWHHHQDTGVMQLVDRRIHINTPHRGGYSIWGKR